MRDRSYWKKDWQVARDAYCSHFVDRALQLYLVNCMGENLTDFHNDISWCPWMKISIRFLYLLIIRLCNESLISNDSHKLSPSLYLFIFKRHFSCEYIYNFGGMVTLALNWYKSDESYHNHFYNYYNMHV